MWKFWIDTGGTFTDCLAQDPDGRELRAKVLSSSAIRGRIVERIEPRLARLEMSVETGDEFFKDYTFDVHGLDTKSFRVLEWKAREGLLRVDGEISDECIGSLASLQSPEEPPTLVARLLTGKRLDQRLPPLQMRLATTRGTNALLEHKGAKIAFLVTKGFRDLLRIGNQQRPNLFELGIQIPSPLYASVYEVSARMTDKGEELSELDESEIEDFAAECARDGIEAVAVSLLHSYAHPEHEIRIGQILRRRGIPHVSLSSRLSPLIKFVPRAETAVVDAYLAPVMDAYLDAVQADLSEDALRIMTSSGGLTTRSQYRPKDSLLSGPAGGLVGAAQAGCRAGFDRSIAFDMGGTSTDVSRFDGRLDYKFQQRIGDAQVFAPSLRIETVAAGGGSICWFDGLALRVGPESAGALPGPACYGAGGPLTLTDVNLLLGRMDEAHFGIPVFKEASIDRFQELVSDIQKESENKVDEEAILLGLLDIANERMAEAIRKISLREGYSPSDYALIAFGGAGGLHACAIADILKMNTIVLPAEAGLLSAFGLKHARLEKIQERQLLRPLDECVGKLTLWEKEMVDEAMTTLKGVESTELDCFEHASQVELRFAGQEASLQVDLRKPSELRNDFHQLFERQYGFLPNQPVEAVSLRTTVSIGVPKAGKETFPQTRLGEVEPGTTFSRFGLEMGWQTRGPAIVQDRFSSIFVDNGWMALVGDQGSIRLTRVDDSQAKEREAVAEIELELHTNRFLSLVDEMGTLLERSAFSTNVKERKDFSCALLNEAGYLVANAPHIPVHLGALGVCVRKVCEVMDLREGDVVITNHPGFGGSHLPDVTLISAVYSNDGDVIGYVANRAHHAELGGISPGSMPPNARSLAEEGVVIAPMYLVKEGEVDWDSIRSVLNCGPYPTRRLKENLSDLAAQLAAIRFGERGLKELVRKEGLPTIAYYMDALRQRASSALQKALQKATSESRSAVERLDNGAEIAVQIRKRADRWLIDFAGSASVQPSSYNATPAIVTSATLYALRLLADEEIPLNEGILENVDILIPEGMLNPVFSEDAAVSPPVVAGNVELSQRIVDTLLKALDLAACSQGTMNNLVFGNEGYSYYETIAGGEGATANHDGASGRHTHMTNTAITDPEILEHRLPVRLERFWIRDGSGGRGDKSGGEGLGRRIRFLEPFQVSLLFQHRVEAPYGLKGGANGKVGEQFKIGANNDDRESIPGNLSLTFAAGEAIEVLTPGGGGWGSPV